jgi:hypothetical protein
MRSSTSASREIFSSVTDFACDVLLDNASVSVSIFDLALLISASSEVLLLSKSIIEFFSESI